MANNYGNLEEINLGTRNIHLLKFNNYSWKTDIEIIKISAENVYYLQ